MSSSDHPRVPEGLTLLVVDDNPVVRIAVVAVARRLGVAAQEAASGEEALERLRRHDRFDAMLIDLRLPGLDGPAVTRAIRSAAEPWSTLPIFGMTGTVSAGDEALCVAAGMGGLLRKPVLRDALAAVLRAQ
jgi:CheY-like chemotaxis protein